jgi:PhnB protein
VRSGANEPADQAICETATKQKELKMQFTPYLSFNGQCEAAFEMYERVLGGKIVFRVPFAQTPMADSVPPDWSNKMCHATLKLGDSALMGCDATPDRYEVPKGIWVTFVPENTAAAERVFAALAENGKVIMALQQTFWAASFGMVIDQFGTPWMINCENK